MSAEHEKPRSNKTKPQATLQRVANHAGVSKATASMILSGQENYRKLFNPQTVSKVCRSAAALNYRTNVFASSLGKNKTPFFALVIPGSGYETWSWRYDAFESLLLGGVLAVSSETNTYPIVLTLSVDATEPRIQAVEDIIAGGVFGTIARTPPPPLASSLRHQLKHGYPSVVIFPEQGHDWPSNVIDADNVRMGKAAGEIFAQNGRRKWAVICFKTRSVSQNQRREGLQSAAKHHGAKLQVIQLPQTLETGAIKDMLISRFLRSSPDAIFGVNARAAVGALLATSQRGQKPGDDVSILGVDAAHWGEESPYNTSVTSLSVSWREAGKTAIQQLLQMRSSGEATFPNTFLPLVLTVGQSCFVPDSLVKTNFGDILQT